ncbi:MAG: methyl-accepting chemotaxis protein [Candidatus Kariarchaeaceae archaeon]|jgi:methyl-accepting chemotaxis protein
MHSNKEALKSIDQAVNTEIKFYGTGYLRTVKWHHVLEMILPLILFFAPLILAINKKRLFGLSSFDLFLWYSLTLSSVLLLTLITIKVIGINDFRFRLFLHAVVIGLTTSVSGLMLRGTGFFDIFDVDNKSDIIIKTSILMIIVMTILVGSMFSLYALTNPFTKEMESINLRIKSGELSAQIDKQRILSDSVFGPPSTIINEITSHLRSLLSEAATTSSLIATASEQLAAGAEDVNTSVEEVASTSQSMSTGATQQAEMINSIVVHMKDAASVIQDIVKQIQNNTETVSQIALQTNILALNAGIEASRAGDYGRGFAVVAENVRKLSDQSKNSAEEISHVVDTISTTLQELFDQMQSGIMNVSAVSEETAASAQEVAAVAEEMTSNMEEVNSLAQTLAEQAEKSNQFLAKAR